MKAPLGLILALLVPATLRSSQIFTGADFSLSLQPEQSSYQPGQTIIFDATLKNLSSQTAQFGSTVFDSSANITPRAESFDATIDGENVFGSPYISDAFGLGDLIQTPPSIAPGGSVQFQFFEIVTMSSTPIGSVIAISTGNMSFLNIPRSDPNSFEDFAVFLPGASVTVVPEPNAPLFASTFLITWLYRRRFRKRKHSAARTE